MDSPSISPPALPPLALSDGGDFTVAAAILVAAVAVCAWWLQRRQLRESLGRAKDRENQLRTIIESEPACVKTVSRDLLLLDMNPAGLALVEADSLEQVRGVDLRQLLHPEDLDAFVALHERVFAGESVSLRFRIVALKGTQRWMQTFAAPLFGVDGAVSAHLAVTHDVTTQVELESRLRASRDAALAGTRAKADFLRNLSHEVRTPMNAMLGWTEVLHEQWKADALANEALSTIDRNGRHLLGLIDDLLDVSRVESGDLEIQRIAFDPRAMLVELRATLRPLVEGTAIELGVDVLPEMPAAVVSDRARIWQILDHLARNAIKFTDEGRVALLARTEMVDGVAQLVFEVHDTGMGIAPEDLERVSLGQLEQVDGGMSRRRGGVGVGWTLSRGLATLLGGSLDLESRLDEGTTARLIVPLVTPEFDASATVVTDARRASTPDAASIVNGRRVLLVEDGADNRRLVGHILERAGCTVTCAENGAVALEQVAVAGVSSASFDVILMDVQMPVLDGHSATRALRDRGCTVPIVALTAHAMVGDRERSIEAGCDGYLPKPVRPRELLREIAFWIANPPKRG